MQNTDGGEIAPCTPPGTPIASPESQPRTPVIPADAFDSRAHWAVISRLEHSLQDLVKLVELLSARLTALEQRVPP